MMEDCGLEDQKRSRLEMEGNPSPFVDFASSLATRPFVASLILEQLSLHDIVNCLRTCKILRLLIRSTCASNKRFERRLKVQVNKNVCSHRGWLQTEERKYERIKFPKIEATVQCHRTQAVCVDGRLCSLTQRYVLFWCDLGRSYTYGWQVQRLEGASLRPEKFVAKGVGQALIVNSVDGVFACPMMIRGDEHPIKLRSHTSSDRMPGDCVKVLGQDCAIIDTKERLPEGGGVEHKRSLQVFRCDTQSVLDVAEILMLEMNIA